MNILRPFDKPGILVNQTFPIFLIGYLVLIAGVAYGMHAAGLGTEWIITAVLILAGVAIVGSMSRSNRGGDGNNASGRPTDDAV